VREDAAVDIGPYVRAGAPFRLIRLTDRTGGCGAGQWPGAEIDTVGAAIAIAPDQALTRRLEAIVAADSIGWRSNRYLAGSMRNARVTEGNFASGTFSVRGDYTYNEDSSGWVIAKFVGGQLSCLQYHDIGATCRAPH
jgi:hypothetical protein